ncbi:MAG: hypothetical protein ACYTGN_06085 [Planctomycetota bacterium]|jgi:hypothetical protein
MDVREDRQYLRLYREYASAIRAFRNATEDRQRVRRHLAAKSKRVVPPDGQRRPVGAGPNWQPSGLPRSLPPKPYKARPVYMGPILGWVTLRAAPTLSEPAPLPDFDADRLYDRTSLRLYWNAKHHYAKCKREFFDYVRRQRIDRQRTLARNELSHEANLQLLGADEDEDYLEQVRQHVELACRDAWIVYQAGGLKKTPEQIELLLRSIADAQFVDLESGTVQDMAKEMERLSSTGGLHRSTIQP